MFFRLLWSYIALCCLWDGSNAVGQKRQFLNAFQHLLKCSGIRMGTYYVLCVMCYRTVLCAIEHPLLRAMCLLCAVEQQIIIAQFSYNTLF